MRKLFIIAGVVVVVVVVIVIIIQLNNKERTSLPEPTIVIPTLTTTPTLEPQPLAAGNLAINIRDVRYNTGEKPKPPPDYQEEIIHWCWIDYTLTETTNKVGIRLIKWELYLTKPNQEILASYSGTNIKELFGTDYIPAGGSLQRSGHAYNYQFTINWIVKYFGVDDNGNPIEATSSVEVVP